MRRLLLIALALLLAACTSQQASPAPPSPLPSPTATTSPTATPAAIPTVPCHASPAGVSAAREAQEYLTPYDHILGDASHAAVFLVVYSDFQCTACAKLAPILRQVQQAHSQEVALVFRHFPLINLHDKAALAAQAAEAAARQGKFWPMHDLLFKEQSRWTGMKGPAFEAYLQEAARRLGLDVARFQRDMQSEAIRGLVHRAWENGINHNLPTVPLLYINAQLYTGPMNFADMDTIVRLQILEQRQFHACPPRGIPPNASVSAELLTTRGVIRLRLFPQEAPNAVNAFAFLASRQWYDNNPILEANADFVRTGDPSGTGYGNAGFTFGLELSSTLNFDTLGRAAFYNTGGDTNSSQFFITRRATPRFNGHATVFGTVTEGMDVVRSLKAGDHLLTVKIYVNGEPWP